jgi:hypothetical protein
MPTVCLHYRNSPPGAGRAIDAAQDSHLYSDVNFVSVLFRGLRRRKVAREGNFQAAGRGDSWVMVTL